MIIVVDKQVSGNTFGATEDVGMDSAGGRTLPIRIMVIDDHPVVRQGLRSLLSQYPDMQVVGESGGGPDCLPLVAKVQPDVVLLDIRLGESNGLDLARQLQRTERRPHVIMLTSYDDDSYLLQAAQAGVRGYLLKNASPEVLADTIRAVNRGERRLTPALGGKALEQLELLGQVFLRAQSGLTEQELHLLRLVAAGASVLHIAQSLSVSERTVKRKTQDILDKLGAANRAQAVAEAYKRGLL